MTTPESIKLLRVVPINNAIELALSPKGTYLSTWIRHIKLEDAAQHKNLQIFYTSSSPSATDATTAELEGEEGQVEKGDEQIVAFTQKAQESWKLQFTEDETFALRSIQNEIHILDPRKAFTLVDKLRIEGLSSFSLSPGKNPFIATFIAEKKVLWRSFRLTGNVLD